MWLADLFYDIADICDNIRVKCTQIAWWLYSHDWPSASYNFFADIAGFFGNAREWFHKVADEINDWWDTISQAVSDIGTLWDYAYGWLHDKAVSAYNWAVDAYHDAQAAWDKAVDAFNAAITEAGNALAEAKTYADGLMSNITTWISEHASDLWKAITGLAVDFGTWLSGLASDLWETTKGFIETAIGIQLSLIALPYNWVTEFREKIESFLESPWDWLEAKFVDWFLGKE